LRVQPDDLHASDIYKKLGCDVQLGKPKLKITSADGLIVSENHPSLSVMKETGIGIFSENSAINGICLHDLSSYAQSQSQERFTISPVAKSPIGLIIRDDHPSKWGAIEEMQPALIFLSPSDNRLHYCRQFFDWLREKDLKMPVILGFQYNCSKEDLIIQSAAEYGALFCDGLGDGILIDAPYEIDFLRTLSFNILQAARMRTSKTDFISCPSCGRTLFDLQDVSKRIRNRTAHLPGVKIAIMGCIVNGPGEMADADFGYVGSKPGMIDLYVGKQCVEKDINFADADDRLVELIKNHGRWAEPELL